MSGWSDRYAQVQASALYLHVPFCVQKCFYCDFPSWATTDGALMSAYAAALETQVAQLSSVGLLAGCQTAYVGGGTPTLLGEKGLASLIRRVVDLTGATEVSSEANPDSLGAGMASTLAASGLTRLSLGVQSTDDRELSALGRIHDGHAALAALGAAVAAGLDVSADLMCAIPHQTSASWEKSVRDVVGTGASHVSVYPLSIEEGTVFGRRFVDEDPEWNDPAVQAERMEWAEALLAQEGFARYEVASYARPGKRCRHNIAYWSGLPYLGVGTGAAGMLTAPGYDALRSVAPQLPAMGEGAARARLTVVSGRRDVASGGDLRDVTWDVEFLTLREAVAEDLMLAARRCEPIDGELVQVARDVIGASRVDGALVRLVARGLLGADLSPTHEGWLLGNELFGELWAMADDVESAV